MALARIAPWIGIAAPPCVWFLAQQGMGELVYLACSLGGAPLGPLIGLSAAAICGGAGWTAWSAREGQPFLARVGAGVSAIFVLGCLALVAAALIVAPPCAR